MVSTQFASAAVAGGEAELANTHCTTHNNNNNLLVRRGSRLHSLTISETPSASQSISLPPLPIQSNESLRRRYSIIQPPPQRRRRSSTLYSSSSKQHRRRIVLILFVFCATNFALGMCSALIAPFFPAEALRKGGSATLAGLVMGSYECVMFILAPVIGHYMYSTIGARFSLIAGPFMLACCTVLFGLLDKSPPGATFFILAVAVRIVSGAGAIAYYVTSIAVRPVLFRDGFGFAFASLTLGLVVGPAVGGVLYSLGGYGLPFWTLGGLTLLLNILQAATLPDLKQHNENAAAEGDASRPTLLILCRNMDILACFGAYCWAGFSVSFYESIISLHILPLLDGSLSRVGFIILIGGACEAAVAPLMGWLQDASLVPPRLAVVIGFVLCAAGLLLMGPSPLLPFFSQVLLWLVIVGTALHGFGLGCFLSAPFKLASDAAVAAGFPAADTTYGLLAGGFATFFSFGAFIGPIAGGILYDQIGFRWATTILGLFAAFMLFVMLIFYAGAKVLVLMIKRR